MKIICASMNPKKATELLRMAPEDVEVICLKDIPEANGVPQAEENGNTFSENALIKAMYWAKKLNMPVIAEDSGLEIDALEGYPGVQTKRCIKQLAPGSDVNVDNPSELYPVLLELMEKSGNQSTRAHWVSAIAYANPKLPSDKSGEMWTVVAVESLDGDMCKCAGEKEFGFDQYFKPSNSDKTLAQLSMDEKDQIGPRKKAFLKVIDKVLEKNI